MTKSLCGQQLPANVIYCFYIYIIGSHALSFKMEDHKSLNLTPYGVAEMNMEMVARAMTYNALGVPFNLTLAMCD